MAGNDLLQNETKKKNVFILEAQNFSRDVNESHLNIEGEVEETSRERIVWNK